MTYKVDYKNTNPIIEICNWKQTSGTF